MIGKIPDETLLMSWFIEKGWVGQVIGARVESGISLLYMPMTGGVLADTQGVYLEIVNMELLCY